MRKTLVLLGILGIGILVVWAIGRRSQPRVTTDPSLVRYRGVVVDELGRPVPAAWIELEPSAGATSPRATRSARDGSFSLEIPDLLDPRVSIAKPTYVTESWTLIPPDATDTTSPSYPLTQGASFTGRVVDADRRPVPQSEIEVRATFGDVVTARTDPEGRFDVTVPAERAVLLTARSERLVDHHGLTIVPPRGASIPDVVLLRGGALRVLVFDLERPLAGALVTVETDAGDRETAMTSDSGVALIPGLGGRRARLIVTRVGYAGRVDETDAPGEDEVRETTVRLDRGVDLSLDLRGLAPPAQATVRVRRGSFDLVELHPGAGGSLPAHFAIGDKYELEIATTGYPRCRVEHRVEQAGERIVVELPRGARISGRVRTGSGRIGARAMFTVSRGDRPGIGTETRGRVIVDGRFRTALLAPGTVHLRIVGSEGGSLHREVELQPGRDIDLGELTLEP
ncbi:MAG: hypothetical protein KDC38_02730 [Planctomycetes bacterium]|nr:hypothetical protein [Planctomycetota bacterium]